jgi:hypothetical protein
MSQTDVHLKIHHFLDLNRKTKKVDKYSEEWYERRKTCIGGSNMYKVVIRGMLPAPDVKNYYCAWGNLFENVAIYYIKRFLYPDRSYTSVDTVYDSKLPVGYSPDGFLSNKKQIDLLEIKCPFMRSIHKDITPDYYAQVQTGMYVFGVENTKFIQFQFRCCTKEQLTRNKVFEYNRKLHKSRFQLYSHLPYYYGFFVFPETEEIKGAYDVTNNMDLLCQFETMKRPDVYMQRSFYDDVPQFDRPYMCWKLMDFKIKDIPENKKVIEAMKPTIWKRYENMLETRRESAKNLETTENFQVIITDTYIN